MNILENQIWIARNQAQYTSLSPERKWLVTFCRTRSNHRNATSYLIRSIQQTWSPTCSYAPTPWCPDPKLSYGTRLPRTVNKGLTAIRALYRHILEIHKKKQKNSAVGCLLCSCSYHSLGPNNIGPYISSKSDLWLAVYPDQIAISAYFITWAG